MASDAKRIEVDIGQAFETLKASPELCYAMNVMVGGPALGDALKTIDELRDLDAAIKRVDELLARDPNIGTRIVGEGYCEATYYTNSAFMTVDYVPIIRAVLGLD